MAGSLRMCMVWCLGLVAATMISSMLAYSTECDAKGDILYIIDSSGSIGQYNYQLSLNFLASITSFFKVGANKVQFAAIVFSSDYSNEIAFDTYNSNGQVEQAIMALPYFGKLTYTGAALKSAREYAFTAVNGARSNVPKVAVVITDGQSTDAHNTRSEAYLLKSSGVTVIVIGVGSGVDPDELEDIASRPDLVFLCGDFSALDSIRAQVEQSVCEEQNNQNVGSCFYDDTSCIGKPDGDYAACDPECKDGYYYSCVAGFRYLRPCALATYIDAYNNQYQARMVYQASTGTCEREVAECPRDPQNHVVVVDPWNSPGGGSGNPCLSPSDSCNGRPNGNYPMCYPECQSGFFYTCSNNETYKMPCPLGNYVDNNNQYFQAMMIYNADTDSCELQLTTCPRDDIDYAVGDYTPDPSGTGSDDMPPTCHAKADILLIMDSSGSIGSQNYEVQKFFLSDVTSFFQLGADAVQFSAMIFSDNYQTIFDFTDYYDNQLLEDAIEDIVYLRGLTYTNKALNAARVFSFTAANGARNNVGKVAVVITDGASTSPIDTYDAADALKASGVVVIAIGVGAHIQQSELEAIATSPSHVFRVHDFNVLGALRNELIKTACESSELFYTCVSNSCQGKADGDYPACDPECRDGYYYTCQNNFLYKRECPLDFYLDEYNTQFLARTVFNHTTGTCERSVDSCPRDPANHVVTPTPYVPPVGSNNTYGPCIGLQDSCLGFPDGDYPLCNPECESGYYFSCVADEAFERPCPFGNYLDQQGNYFQAMMVFNPEVGYCTLTASYCPRTVVNPGPTTPPTTPPDPPTCSSKGDVLFLVDSSGSIGQANFNALVAFLANIVTYLDIGPDAIQVSAIVFSTNSILAFKFDEYATDADVFQAILNLPYLNGLTNTHLALEEARVTAFDPMCGARTDVPKVVVIITDGVSRRPIQTELEADQLKRSGVTSIVVGIGGYLRQSELDALASDDDLIFKVNDFGVLDAIKADIVTATCTSTEDSCLIDESSCVDQADGDYQICGEQCKAGYYMQCANGIGYQRFCPLGIYWDGGRLFYARLVFDPYYNYCADVSPSCPRNALDYEMGAND